jgi:SAM-dependent methyltransferase
MWQLDVLGNTIKAMLPFQSKLRALKRQWCGYEFDRPNSELALDQGLKQLDDLRACSITVEGTEVLDLGSGWHPVVPMLFRIAGAARVHLTDLECVMDAQTVHETAEFLRGEAMTIAERLGLPERRIRARLVTERGLAFDEQLEQLGFTYTVPFDSASMPSVDLVVSRTTLEHVSPDMLRRLFADFHRAIRPAGAMAHIIDNSDHRQHRDGSLSRIDFLQYSEGKWRLLCANPQDYTNRLRHSDYGTLIREAGFAIALDRAETDAAAAADARHLPLTSAFRTRPVEDLAALTSHFVARLVVG